MSRYDGVFDPDERTVEVALVGGPRDGWHYRVNQMFDIHHHLPTLPLGGSWQPPEAIIVGTVGQYVLGGLDERGMPVYHWFAGPPT